MLDGEVFTRLDAGWPRKAKHFAEGSPDDSNDYLIFDRGRLLYDKDGDGQAHGKLAAVLNDEHLHESDVLIG